MNLTNTARVLCLQLGKVERFVIVMRSRRFLVVLTVFPSPSYQQANGWSKKAHQTL